MPRPSAPRRARAGLCLAASLLAAALALPFAATAATPADGSADRGFGRDGIAQPQFPIYDDALASIAVQGDGGVLALSADYTVPNDWGTLRCRLLRLDRDGRVDPRFGDGGQVAIVQASRFGNSSCAQLLLQPDGKIVVVGSLDADLMLLRFNADGSADTGFGDGGKSVVDTFYIISPYAAALQADGKVVVAGEGFDDSAKRSVALAVRVGADGRADAGFGRDGLSVTDLPELRFGVYAGHLALQPDGRILMAGGASPLGLLLLRLRPDGSPDPEFGQRGRVIAHIDGMYDDTAGLLLLNDGSLLSSHFVWPTGPGAPTRGAVLRWRADGSRDPGFRSPDLLVGGELIAQADGRILAAANRGDIKPHGLIQRFALDGTVDASFVPQLPDVGDDDAYLGPIAFADDGRIVIAARYDRSRRYAVARLHNATYCLADPADPGRFLGFSPSGWFSTADSGVGGSGAGLIARGRVRTAHLPGQPLAYALSAGGPAPAAYRADAFAVADGAHGFGFANIALRRAATPGRYALVDARANDSACRPRSGR
ncbi:delta-60 repeat protein [Lysobacter enzymogenes]|uniref:Delta-60 repeat protein n=1 Tax=Lysobacter enzymogenes TaxID=69 RepID=A0A0S2DJ24_LYSEN|nr:delta-60 repeat domain-containing protein [Lysobacter enzymogenes]ALN58629.1 delta-60 repeat protein [Lysobacter enzymogenes]